MVTGIDFSAANGAQRKALRTAITSTFNKRTLQRFLDEELEINLDDLAAEDDFPNTVWQLIQKMRSRGLIGRFMSRWSENEEFGNSPALADLLRTWPLLFGEGRAGAAAIAIAIAAAPPADPIPPPSLETIVLPQQIPDQPGENRQKGDLQSILDNAVSRMPAATWLKGIAALSRQVCMIRTGNSRFATGFLVGPRLVMTAAHTVSYLAGEREPMEAVFDDLSGDEAKWTVVGIRDVVASDPVNLEQPGDWFQTADFALLELASDLPDSDRGLRSWIDFGGHRSRLFPGEGVITLYHPGMMGLMVAQGAVANRSALTGRFGHNASTVPGASGAPVFDAKLKLIGMHESAFAGEAPNEKLNYAVRADAIARALEARDFKLPVPA